MVEVNEAVRVQVAWQHKQRRCFSGGMTRSSGGQPKTSETSEEWVKIKNACSARASPTPMHLHWYEEEIDVSRHENRGRERRQRRELEVENTESRSNRKSGGRVVGVFHGSLQFSVCRLVDVCQRAM